MSCELGVRLSGSTGRSTRPTGRAASQQRACGGALRATGRRSSLQPQRAVGCPQAADHRADPAGVERRGGGCCRRAGERTEPFEQDGPGPLPVLRRQRRCAQTGQHAHRPHRDIEIGMVQANDERVTQPCRAEPSCATASLHVLPPAAHVHAMQQHRAQPFPLGCRQPALTYRPQHALLAVRSGTSMDPPRGSASPAQARPTHHRAAAARDARGPNDPGMSRHPSPVVCPRTRSADTAPPESRPTVSVPLTRSWPSTSAFRQFVHPALRGLVLGDPLPDAPLEPHPKDGYDNEHRDEEPRRHPAERRNTSPADRPILTDSSASRSLRALYRAMAACMLTDAPTAADAASNAAK